MAEGDIDTIPGIRGVNGCLSQGGPVLWVGLDNFNSHIFWQSSKEEVVLLTAKPFIFALFAVWYQEKIAKI